MIDQNEENNNNESEPPPILNEYKGYLYENYRGRFNQLFNTYDQWVEVIKIFENYPFLNHQFWPAIRDIVHKLKNSNERTRKCKLVYSILFLDTYENEIIRKLKSTYERFECFLDLCQRVLAASSLLQQPATTGQDTRIYLVVHPSVKKIYLDILYAR